MQQNRGMQGTVQLQQQVNSPIYDSRHQFSPAQNSLHSMFELLCSPGAAVFESALLMILIGWMDYKTTDFAMTVFYFGPVVLATWRAGRKAGWFIALLCGVTVLIADLMVPRSGRVLAVSYINAGILVLASAALAELVSSYRRAHERLKTLLALRTVSLNEIHHRVKNNLQIISSLLRLQSTKFADLAVRDVFTECRERINAMARLHDQLYNEAGRSHLDFAPHLRELADMLVVSHTPPTCKLTLKVAADSVPLDLDQSILLSLISNELLLNPLKHAFRGRATGNIDAELRRTPDRITLTIRDDGIGFVPVPVAADEHRGAGIDLVRAMARQLGGELVINNAPAGGTSATIFFPNKLSRQTGVSSPSSTNRTYAKAPYSDC
ncbi:MAG: sensor histidine kinase [Alphaproteobacteria bacterium]